MLAYYCLLSWVTIWSFLYLFIKRTKLLDVLYLLAVFIPTVFFVGLRNESFPDTSMYIRFFQDVQSDSWMNLLTGHYVHYYEKVEIVYILLNKLITEITTNVTYFFLLCSMITFWGIGYFLYKESMILPISVFLFFALGYYLPPLNVVRQYIAISFILIGYSCLMRNKQKKYFISVLIASLFHMSAILMEGILLIRPWIRKHFGLIMLAITIAFLCCMFSVSWIISHFDKYSAYLNSSYMDRAPWGLGLLKIPMLWGIPGACVYIALKRGYYSERAEMSALLCLVFAVLSMLITLAQYVFFQIISRYLMYTEVFTILLIPYALVLFTRRTQILLCLAIFVAGWIYYAWYIHTMMGKAIVPY